jgi:exosortase
MALAALSLVLLLAWAATLRDLAAVWATSRYASHGFCVAALAAYAAWDARSGLPRIRWCLRRSGGGTLALAVGLLAVGHAADSLTLRALSLPLAGLAAVLVTLGAAGARALAFPLGLLLLAVPLPEAVLARLSAVTQALAAAVAEQTLALAHIPVVRDGLTLRVGRIALEVTEDCNGLPFLLTSVVIGAAAAWGLRLPRRQRVTIVALAVMAGVVANPVRVAGTAILAWLEPAAVVGTPHLVFGKLVYLVVGGAFAAGAALLVHGSSRHPAYPDRRGRHDP